MSDDKPKSIQEGFIKKGGIRSRPKSPRPPAPKGQDPSSAQINDLLAENERLKFEHEQMESHCDEAARLHGIITVLNEDNAKLRATLDGDPHQTATPEDRRAWRASAVRYADKGIALVRECRDGATPGGPEYRGDIGVFAPTFRKLLAWAGIEEEQ